MKPQELCVGQGLQLSAVVTSSALLIVTGLAPVSGLGRLWFIISKIPTDSGEALPTEGSAYSARFSCRNPAKKWGPLGGRSTHIVSQELTWPF